ncbi:MAG: tRNA pseudouridine(38-40) synthase TruA [Candidatus Methanomethylophilaceae archaeon]|nr:tRNA pseudouridine(38-40) synthase TruA [Candidatus Methanomethylophilaceae archaeon]
MRRVAVKIAYIGEGFNGSQIQPVGRTVESEVLDKLVLVSKITPEELDLKFSSRTDKGVNALGNAISFNSVFTHNTTLLRALNAVGGDIFFRSICEVPDDFNVRYATSRIYRYILPAEGLDIDRALECADVFIGEHDFARFCKPDNKPTIANVERIDIDVRGDMMIFEFEARFFLWNMIRRMVAAIESVAKGIHEIEDVHRALDDLQEINFGVARPDALTLLDVNYDWLTFERADPSQFEERKKEDSFRRGLRGSFYNSLL